MFLSFQWSASARGSDIRKHRSPAEKHRETNARREAAEPEDFDGFAEFPAICFICTVVLLSEMREVFALMWFLCVTRGSLAYITGNYAYKTRSARRSAPEKSALPQQSGSRTESIPKVDPTAVSKPQSLLSAVLQMFEAFWKWDRQMNPHKLNQSVCTCLKM